MRGTSYLRTCGYVDDVGEGLDLLGVARMRRNEVYCGPGTLNCCRRTGAGCFAKGLEMTLATALDFRISARKVPG